MPEATVDQVKQLLGPAAVRYTDEEISRSLEEAKEFMAMKGVGSAAMPRASYGKAQRLLAARSLLAESPAAANVASRSEGNMSITYRDSDSRISIWDAEIGELLRPLRPSSSPVIPLYDNY